MNISNPASLVFPLDEPLPLGMPLSLREIRSSWLAIAPEQGAWFVTDNPGKLLLGRLRTGESPLSSVVSTSLESGVHPTVLLASLHRLVRQIYLAGLLSPETWQDESTLVVRCLHVYATSQCNLRCRHCYRAPQRAHGAELTTAEILEVFREFCRLAGPANVVLSGGEPLMRDDLFTLLEAAASIGHQVALFTNGTHLDEATLSAIAPWVASIQISLDGASAAGHDAVRGTGAFARTAKAIQLVGKFGIPLDVAVTVNPDNFEDLLQNTVRLAAFLAPTRAHIRVAVVQPAGQALLSWSDVCSPGLVKAAEQLTRRLTIQPGIAEAAYRTPRRRISCGYGPGLHLDSDGTVYVCREIEGFAVGNIREIPFSLAYERVQVQYRATTVDTIEECRGCDLRHICSGGCRIQNKILYGDPRKPSCTAASRADVYHQLYDVAMAADDEEENDHEEP